MRVLSHHPKEKESTPHGSYRIPRVQSDAEKEKRRRKDVKRGRRTMRRIAII